MSGRIVTGGTLIIRKINFRGCEESSLPSFNTVLSEILENTSSISLLYKHLSVSLILM
jgi:hypothetical protein